MELRSILCVGLLTTMGVYAHVDMRNAFNREKDMLDFRIGVISGYAVTNKEQAHFKRDLFDVHIAKIHKSRLALDHEMEPLKRGYASECMKESVCTNCNNIIDAMVLNRAHAALLQLAEQIACDRRDLVEKELLKAQAVVTMQEAIVEASNDDGHGEASASSDAPVQE